MSNHSARTYWRRAKQQAFGNQLAKDPALQALNESEQAEIAALLPLLQGLTVLDLGAGVGRYTGYFARTAAQVTALDLVPEAMAENRARHADFSNIDYVVADVVAFDYGAQRFDLVFANWLLRYLDDADVAELLTRLTRGLKPGGQCFVHEVCLPPEQSGWRRWLAERLRRDRVQVMRTPAEYEALFRPHLTLRASGHLASYEAAFGSVQQHYWLLEKPAQAEALASPVGDGLAARPRAWSFSGDTWQTFDDHIRRSIPFYDQLHELICGFAAEIAQPGGMIYELGCSTGTLSRRLSQACPDSRVCGVDAEPAMVAKAQTRRRPNLEYHCADIRQFPLEQCDFAVLCYTLQFLPEADRLSLLERIRVNLRPGGGLILAEKVRHQDREFDDLCRRVHHAFKRSQGHTQDEIDAKDRSLEGVLMPLTEEGNIGLLQQAGFRTVNPVFQNTAFTAWLAIK